MSREPAENINVQKGQLYVVPTPIGNLEDMTLRGIRILREVDFIAAEDTRHTRKLLTHFDIHPGQLFSYHQHNLKEAGEKILALLQLGQMGALVSDAGMPGISDPGQELIQDVIRSGLNVEVLPGPSAFVTALVGSGLATGFFTFVGFLPRGKKNRKLAWEHFANLESTLIFYESPHRLRATLEEMYEVLGSRNVAVIKELSKLHETYFRGNLEDRSDLVSESAQRGEFVIVVEGAQKASSTEAKDEPVDSVTLRKEVEAYILKGYSKKEALKEVAKTRSIPRRVVYQSLLEDKNTNLY